MIRKLSQRLTDNITPFIKVLLGKRYHIKTYESVILLRENLTLIPQCPG